MSSPSSHTITSPRSTTGANTAALVPITTVAWPRSTANHRRYRSAGPNSAESATTRCTPTFFTHSADSASISRWSGTIANTPLPVLAVARAASASRRHQASPGSACQTARAARPCVSASKNRSPR
ncbi:Uncharacterised protein [Mycobacteroides abscessus subsp. abscessus]|nr:Uncharacterised protein [Mycobacteroides abscessus subsp. abscessus]